MHLHGDVSDDGRYLEPNRSGFLRIPTERTISREHLSEDGQVIGLSRTGTFNFTPSIRSFAAVIAMTGMSRYDGCSRNRASRSMPLMSGMTRSAIRRSGSSILAVEALKIMETHKITSVVVVDGVNAVEGVGPPA